MHRAGTVCREGLLRSGDRAQNQSERATSFDLPIRSHEQKRPRVLIFTTIQTTVVGRKLLVTTQQRCLLRCSTTVPMVQTTQLSRASNRKHVGSSQHEATGGRQVAAAAGTRSRVVGGGGHTSGNRPRRHALSRWHFRFLLAGFRDVWGGRGKAPPRVRERAETAGAEGRPVWRSGSTSRSRDFRFAPTRFTGSDPPGAFPALTGDARHAVVCACCARASPCTISLHPRACVKVTKWIRRACSL